MNPLRHLEDRLVPLLRLWLMVGILLRVTQVRDRFDGLSLVYYSTPWPAMMAAFVLLAVHYWRRGKMHPVRRYAAFTVVAGLVWISLSWFSNPPPPELGGIRLLLWNTARPNWALAGTMRWVREQDADVICLAEVEPKNKSTADRWEAAFPDYRFFIIEGNFAVFVRGEVLSMEQGPLGPGSFYGMYRVRVRGREFSILQADLIAKPYRSRREPIARMIELARRAGSKVLIAGDLNTPADSAHLRPLRTDFRNAFEAVGRGFQETWPMPFPALSLDQVWLGPGLRPIACEHIYKIRSDHRAVLVTFLPEL